jgi:hypothetical protein
MTQKEKVVLTGYGTVIPRKISNFPFWAMLCDLTKVTQNCNGTWQSHN